MADEMIAVMMQDTAMPLVVASVGDAPNFMMFHHVTNLAMPDHDMPDNSVMSRFVADVMMHAVPGHCRGFMTG